MIQLCFFQTSEITVGFYGFYHSGPAVTTSSPRASQLSLVIIYQLCFLQTPEVIVYLYEFYQYDPAVFLSDPWNHSCFLWFLSFWSSCDAHQSPCITAEPSYYISTVFPSDHWNLLSFWSSCDALQSPCITAEPSYYISTVIPSDRCNHCLFVRVFISMIQLCFLQTFEITAGFYGFCHSGPAVTPTSPRASQPGLVVTCQLLFFQTTEITVYLYGFNQ